MTASLEPRPATTPATTQATTQTTDLPGESGLRNGVHVLTSVLLITTVSASLSMPLQYAAINLSLSALFAFLYFFGSNQYREWAQPWRWAWIAALTALWLGLLPLGSIGIYLVLPLFFLYMMLFPGLRGTVLVVCATVVSILVQVPTGLTPGGVIGPAISAVVVVAISYAFSKLWQVTAERAQLIEQLMATRSELADTQHAAGIVAERSRIANEIHDTVAQGLSSIQMLLHAAERDLAATGLGEAEQAPVLRRIGQARQTAADNLQEARAMIAALQPAGLSQTSLEGALERMASSFAAAGNLDIEVAVDGASAAELPMKAEATLLRIAQGAVGNVVKHSGATRARVTLGLGEDEVRLDVVDNGAGFDPEVVGKRPVGLGHVGIAAMRRRAAEIGGTLEIESAPGEGTAVSVVIPRVLRS